METKKVVRWVIIWARAAETPKHNPKNMTVILKAADSRMGLALKAADSRMCLESCCIVSNVNWVRVNLHPIFKTRHCLYDPTHTVTVFIVE